MTKILAPAGKVEYVPEIISSGADHVYTGIAGLSREGPRAGLRLKEVLELVGTDPHLAKKIHIALNVVPREEDAGEIFDVITSLQEKGIGTIILNDLGMIRMVRERFPGISITASVGLTTSCLPGALFLEKAGANSVVLPTGADPEDAKMIKEKSSLKVETFIYCRDEPITQGTCMLSGYLIEGRVASGNQTCSAKRTGSCNTICRSIFSKGPDLDDTGRTGLWLDAGVDFLKIEGRYRKIEELKEIIGRVREAVASHREVGEKTSRSS